MTCTMSAGSPLVGWSVRTVGGPLTGRLVVTVKGWRSLMSRHDAVTGVRRRRRDLASGTSKRPDGASVSGGSSSCASCTRSFPPMNPHQTRPCPGVPCPGLMAEVGFWASTVKVAGALLVRMTRSPWVLAGASLGTVNVNAGPSVVEPCRGAVPLERHRAAAAETQPWR